MMKLDPAQEKVKDLIDEIIRVFSILPEYFATIENGAKIVGEGLAFGDLNNDIPIKAEVDLGAFIYGEFLKKLFYDCSIEIEGSPSTSNEGEVNFSTGEYRLTVDPLDNSIGFKFREASLGLPISTCMTLLERHEEQTCFSDVIFAGVMDLRSPNDFWRAELAENGEYQSYLNGVPCKTMDASKFDLYNQIFLADMHYPKNREMIFYGFMDDLGSIRSLGSSAYEMALVASGQAVAYFSQSQTPYELGAGYALVKGAGGVVVDLDGKDLGEREYALNDWTPVIAAANQAIAEQILEKILLKSY